MHRRRSLIPTEEDRRNATSGDETEVEVIKLFTSTGSVNEIKSFLRKVNDMKSAHVNRINNLMKEAEGVNVELTEEHRKFVKYAGEQIKKRNEYLNRLKQIQTNETVLNKLQTDTPLTIVKHQAELECISRLEEESHRREEKIKAMKEWITTADDFLRFIREEAIVSEEVPLISKD